MSEVLQSLSNALASTVESVGASVVRVEGRRRMPATGIVWSADGLIVTAHHVVERDENIKVGLPDGSTAVASLVGRDPSTDLAVLRVQGASLKAPQWADTSDLRVGNLVLAIGHPTAKLNATLGIISALEDGSNLPAGMQLDHFLQTDVVMYPGFSGGPLATATGQIAGLNTSALVRGISVAVPTSTIRRVAETLVKHGKMRRGFLGVGVQPVRLPAPLPEQLGQETGLLVLSAEPNSPSDGKLYMGDTIVAIAGKSVHDPDDLINALAGDLIGKHVTVKIVRGGQVSEVSVTVGERA